MVQGEELGRQQIWTLKCQHGVRLSSTLLNRISNAELLTSQLLVNRCEVLGDGLLLSEQPSSERLEAPQFTPKYKPENSEEAFIWQK